MRPRIIFDRLLVLARSPEIQALDPAFGDWLAARRDAIEAIIAVAHDRSDRRLPGRFKRDVGIPATPYLPGRGYALSAQDKFTGSPLWQDIDRFLYAQGSGGGYDDELTLRGDLAGPEFDLAQDLYQAPERMSPEDFAYALRVVPAYMAKIRAAQPSTAAGFHVGQTVRIGQDDVGVIRSISSSQRGPHFEIEVQPSKYRKGGLTRIRSLDRLAPWATPPLPGSSTHFPPFPTDEEISKDRWIPTGRDRVAGILHDLEFAQAREFYWSPANKAARAHAMELAAQAGLPEPAVRRVGQGVLNESAGSDQPSRYWGWGDGEHAVPDDLRELIAAVERAREGRDVTAREAGISGPALLPLLTFLRDYAQKIVAYRHAFEREMPRRIAQVLR